MVPETEIAWAAGFYDGEGCTMLARKNGTAALRCCVTQKDRRVLDRFLAAVGVGKIYLSQNLGAPWRWQTTSDPDSRAALALLWPYLSQMKREQAEEKIEGSTWHAGIQMLCTDPTHERVRRVEGGRRCRTCQQAYNKAWKLRRKAALAEVA